ncbi:MAG: hypothetical protein KBD78_04510 [Oligoflexales bacterium]|nr:hypothetical protein [Oligoflexales bacterium]
MRPVNNWFLGVGRKNYNHIGLAWFYSITDKYGSYGLFTKDSDASIAPSCLWDEYKTYSAKYNKSKPKISTNFTSDNCSKIDVILPGRDWNAKHRLNAVLYDAASDKRIAHLVDMVQPAAQDACALGKFFPGNSQYPDSYSRFYLKESEFKQNLQCHPNLTSSSIKVRFEFNNGMPYTSFSNPISVSMPNQTSCWSNFIPIVAARAKLGLPGEGWKNGTQVQNLGSTSANVKLYISDDSGRFQQCGAPRQLAVNNSTTYLTDHIAHCRIEGDTGFGGAAFVVSTQPVATLVNIVNRGVGEAGGQYAGRLNNRLSNKIFFPLVKANYSGRSTKFYIQNASNEFNEFTAEFRFNGQVYRRTYKRVAPFSIRVLAAADAGVPQGSGQVGSLSVTGLKNLASTSIEHEYDVNKLSTKSIQAVAAMMESDGGSKVYCPLYRNKHSTFSITSGLQVQNVDTVKTNVELILKGAGRSFGPYLKSIEPNASATFYAPSLLGLPQGFVGSATISSKEGKKIVAIMNESSESQNIEIKSAYSCFSKGTKKIYLPLAKESYGGDTAGISIQNVGAAASFIEISYFSAVVGKPPLRFKSKVAVPVGGFIGSYLPSKPSQLVNWQKISGDDPATYSNSALSAIVEAASSDIIAVVNEASDSANPNPSMQDSKIYEGINYP